MTERDWFQVLILALCALGVVWYLVQRRRKEKGSEKNFRIIDSAPALRKRRWRWDLLSEREMEISNLVAEGKTNKEIARKLHISENTVISHLHNVYMKLDVRNRVELTKALKERIDP